MTDAFTRYETGLARLLERLSTGHPRYNEARLLEAQLRDNICQVRLTGDTSDRRADRYRIVGQLNQLAEEAVRTSFEDLCKPQRVDDLNRLREAVLTHYGTEEQRIVASFVKQLDQPQLATLRVILNALKANCIPVPELGQALDAVQRTLQALPQHIADSIDRQTVANAIEDAADVKHKLKLALPIVPVLLSHGDELELSSRINLKGMWKRLKAIALGYKRALLISTVIAGTLGVASTLLSSTLQLGAPQRLIVAVVFCLAIAVVLCAGSRRARVRTTGTFLALEIAITTFAAFLLVVGFTIKTVAAIKTLRCRNAQASACLRLDLASGTQEKCPDKGGVIVLPLKELAEQSCLSGQATVTPTNSCPCTWTAKAEPGGWLEALHKNPTRDCSFSFRLPHQRAAKYDLILVFDGQHQPALFSIKVQDQ